MRKEGKISFQLSMYPEDREMIKADAKALGMVPSDYIVMVCKILNETTREFASAQFAENLTKAVMKGYEKSLK